jgi:hypothetical protein
MQSRCYYCQVLVKLENSRHIFEKYTNNKTDWSRIVPCGRADRHGELIVVFHSFANAPNTVSTALRQFGQGSPSSIHTVLFLKQHLGYYSPSTCRSTNLPIPYRSFITFPCPTQRPQSHQTHNAW